MTATRQQAGARHILQDCGRLSSGEAVAIICDPTTRLVADMLDQAARALGGIVNLVEIAPLSMHGQDPGPAAAAAMIQATLVLGVTAKSMAHTAARRNACLAGARYLSLPEYTLQLLADPSVTIDYEKAGQRARIVADLFTNATRVRVTTDLGTELELNIEGRIGNCCPGYVVKAGELGSPPDVEANVSPVETFSRGTLVVDGSIPFPELGLLRTPMVLTVRDGGIVRIEGDQAIARRLEDLFDSVDPHKSRILAECGVGLNPMAKLTGVMLTDEGALGTMHFGFGSNATVGGINDVPFHLDFVCRSPTLEIDGRIVLAKGQYIL